MRTFFQHTSDLHSNIKKKKFKQILDLNTPVIFNTGMLLIKDV